MRHAKADVWGRGAVGGHWAIWPLARAPTWLASQNKAKDKPTRQDNNAQANTTSQHDKPTRQANTTRQHITHTTHTHAHTCPGQTHTTHMNIRPSATVVRRFPRSHWLKRGQLHDLGGGGLGIRLAPSFALFFRCNGNLICQYSDSSGVFAIFRTM